jgi:hypothetical protein
LWLNDLPLYLSVPISQTIYYQLENIIALISLMKYSKYTAFNVNLYDDMKTYSLDLRQKIVDAYAVGDISQRKLAKKL